VTLRARRAPSDANALTFGARSAIPDPRDSGMTALHSTTPRARRGRSVCIAAAAALLAAGGIAAGAASAQTVTFTFTGRGWGHGLGMSQYGAEGMAAHGWSASRIMEWYFRQTTVGTIASVTPSTPIRVLMSTGLSSVAVATSATGTSTGTATDLANSVKHPLVPGQTYVLRKVQLANKSWVVRLTGPGTGTATVAQSTSGFRIAPGSGGLVTLAGRKYRGTIATTYASGLRTVETVGIDDYVRGVVPWEMSSSWHPAALQAQAIASRSYALASRRPGSYFDVYGGQPSEAYGGVGAETAATNAAVAATAGQVDTYHGAIVQTFYASSSGGHTESIQNVWGSTPKPYYTGVPDPYETAPEDPWRSPPTFSAAQLGRDLGLGAPVASLTVTRRGVSPRVMMTRVTLTNGRTVNLSGNTIQADLGLMSTWFSVTRTPPLTPASRVSATAIAGHVVTHFSYPRWRAAFALLRSEAINHPGAVTAILARGAGARPTRATMTAFVAARYTPALRGAALHAFLGLTPGRQVAIMARALVAGR
jgi:stage II sporulation protein D